MELFLEQHQCNKICEGMGISTFKSLPLTAILASPNPALHTQQPVAPADNPLLPSYSSASQSSRNDDDLEPTPNFLRPDVPLDSVSFHTQQYALSPQEWEDLPERTMEWSTSESYKEGCDLSRQDAVYSGTGLVGRGWFKFCRYVRYFLLNWMSIADHHVLGPA
jgi:hypothetical protein